MEIQHAIAEMPKIGTRVFNHCTESNGTLTGRHPDDRELFLVDDVDYFHYLWFDVPRKECQ
jgi:hypothetical protein